MNSTGGDAALRPGKVLESGADFEVKFRDAEVDARIRASERASAHPIGGDEFETETLLVQSRGSKLRRAHAREEPGGLLGFDRKRDSLDARRRTAQALHRLRLALATLRAAVAESDDAHELLP